MKTRLVTFLGTGNYQPVIYRDSVTGRCAAETKWIARALAELHRPAESIVLATPTAKEKHGKDLYADLGYVGFHPELRAIPEGGASHDLWQQFEIIKTALRAPEGVHVILDITHGFRSQPFFAAAVVAFIRAVDVGEVPLSVVYGGFEAKDKAGVAPIWELTPFVDLLDYAREIMLFLKTGRVAGIASRAEALGRLLNKDWAKALPDERGPQPRLSRLAQAISAFGQDLETVRTGALLLGKTGTGGTAKALATIIEAERTQLAKVLPPLADVLDRIAAMAAPLIGCSERLNTSEGHAALAALAKLYLDMGRYSEAATTVREGLVTLYADDAAACPGLQDMFKKDMFKKVNREQAERTWYTRDQNLCKQVADPRNDIDHAGFRTQPLPADALATQIKRLVEQFQDAKAAPARSCQQIFVNISNHPSSDWDEGQRAAALALAPTIVDVPFPAVPPDATSKDIGKLCEACLASVPAGASHAMVQGEFTLAYALVRALQRQGTVCFAATTERDIDAADDGAVMHRFRFIRFREYPNS
jgi:CRISPR-associated protein Csx16